MAERSSSGRGVVHVPQRRGWWRCWPRGGAAAFVGLETSRVAAVQGLEPCCCRAAADRQGQGLNSGLMLTLGRHLTSVPQAGGPPGAAERIKHIYSGQPRVERSSCWC